MSNGSTELWYLWKNGEMVFDDLLTQLISLNKGMIISISTKYHETYLHIKYDLEDWMSLANYGVYKAIIGYEPDCGSKLTTFIHKCIHNELTMEQGRYRFGKYQDRSFEFVNVDGLTTYDHNRYFIESDYIVCPERHLLITDALKRAGELLGEPDYIQLRFKGYNNNEIARLLGKKESTVGNRVRAFQNGLRLEQKLGEVI